MICSKCNLEKDENCFSFKNKKKNTRNVWCKECMNLLSKERWPILKDRNYKFILDWLLKHPCVDCGESDPVVLDFDHLENKKESVSKLVSSGFSIELIEKEIQKCVVRCANCHRRKTAKERNWYKLVINI